MAETGLGGDGRCGEEFLIGHHPALANANCREASEVVRKSACIRPRVWQEAR
jgi:hypothetical protein